VRVWVASRGGDCRPYLQEAGIGHLDIPLTTKCEVSPKVALAAARLRGFIAEEGIDIIHANTRVTQVLAFLLSAATKRPYLTTCHGYFRPHLGRRCWPCWGRRVIAISDQVREHLIRDFGLDPAKVELIYNGVDADRFRPLDLPARRERKRQMGLDPDKKTVGHIGRLSSVKGQRFFVLAAAHLSAQRPDLQFLLVGDGPEAGALRRLIREKGLGRIFFTVPAVEDTSQALGAMDVFVMPSVQEGLGLSILEAQAQGVPVVASRVGGIPTVIEDRRTGLLCPAEDAGLLAAGIRELLQDADLSARLVVAARAQVEEKFSLSRMARQTRDFYGKILTD
jgi:glycosyltransferase involved in cell wall biosynthesis